MGANLMLAIFEPKNRERFESKIDKRGENECWIWTGNLSSKGYGTFRMGKCYRPHRLAIILDGRELEDTQVAMHSCDNPPCVNPRHLTVGTISDNNLDMVRKGRQVRGEANGQSRLTADEVRTIHAMLEDGTPIPEIARTFNIVKSAIYKIASGENWSWVTGRIYDGV